MPRTAVPLTLLTREAVVLQPAGVALDPANGHVIAAPTSPGAVLIDIDSTFAGAKTFTIKASPWAPGGEAGDVVITLNAQRGIFQVQSANHFQLDGTINVDVAAAATGTIRAYKLQYV